MEALFELAAQRASNSSRIRSVYKGRVVELGHLQQNCSAHGPYFAVGIGVTASSQETWTSCEECVEQYRDALRISEENRAAQHKRNEIAQRIADAQIPLRFSGKRLTDYRVDVDGQKKVFAIAQDYVDRFAMHRERGASLIFAGLPGTGKSLLAMLALQEVCRKGYGGRYTTLQGLVQAVRRTWGKDGEGRETDVLDDFCHPSLLVIDEIGVQAGTDNEKGLLFEVIDRRYADMRPTILATNLNKEGFREFVGDRIWDRLTEVGRWVPFVWESYRPTARREMAE